jgi:hypothetical protein
LDSRVTRGPAAARNSSACDVLVAHVVSCAGTPHSAGLVRYTKPLRGGCTTEFLLVEPRDTGENLRDGYLPDGCWELWIGRGYVVKERFCDFVVDLVLPMPMRLFTKV